AVAMTALRRQHEHVGQVAEGRAVGDDAGKRDLAVAVEKATEAQRAGDRPLHRVARDAVSPVAVLRQERVDHVHVKPGAVGADAKGVHACGSGRASRLSLPTLPTCTMVALAFIASPQRLIWAHSVLLIPNSLMKPSASSTPQSADCA